MRTTIGIVERCDNWNGLDKVCKREREECKDCPMIEDKELEIHKVFISMVVEVEATSCEEAELLAFRKLQQKIGANLTVKSTGHAVATVRGFKEE